tara:strand:- start:305 stop:490 length:186 start_codon:yes stop_codon:yes gene_type:complete
MNWKGRLKYSGRMNKKGIEITQKTMNPTISYVVVGTLEANVFGIFAKDGQIAVIQTLYQYQ